MTRHFSLLISWSCLAVILLAPLAALYYLFNLDAFAGLTRTNLPLPIRWPTVTDGQWYALWGLTVLYAGVGITGLYFLRRAFSNFAHGELFNLANSRDLRMFSILLFVQALAKPLHFTLSSLLLSFNHPAGQKMISVSLGSNEIKVILLAMILWVISDLLIAGSKLETENKAFV